MYIYHHSRWPHFVWDEKRLLSKLCMARNIQGTLLGKMESLGFSLREEAVLETLTINVIKSSEIEGEHLNYDQVRSSIARRLGVDTGGLVPSSRNVEGVVEMMLDATHNYERPLTKERIFAWHVSLFPTGRSGMHKITVGSWRKDEGGPMQIVSGALGKEKVHYQAPLAKSLEKEMSRFIAWFNRKSSLEPVIKAAIAHLWFVIIHPFDDGNGRIARAISDMQLSRADKTRQRFYSISAQMEHEKKSYYNILEKTTRHGSMDVTTWLLWFVECLCGALEISEKTLEKIFSKAKFWKQHATTIFNERQVLMLNKLLNDFYGKLTTSKWAKITKCSQDTALRDIQDLIKKGVLLRESSGGRSSCYELKKLMEST